MEGPAIADPGFAGPALVGLAWRTSTRRARQLLPQGPPERSAAAAMVWPWNTVSSVRAGTSSLPSSTPATQGRRKRSARVAGRKDDAKEGPSDEAPSIPDYRRGRRDGRRRGRRLRARRVAGVEGAEARHVVSKELPGDRHIGGAGRQANRHRNRRPGHGARVQCGRAGARVRGVRCRLGRSGGNVLLRRVLLCGEVPGAQLLHCGSVRDDPHRGVGMAPVRRRLRTLERSPRRVRHGAVCRSLLRDRDGRMGQPAHLEQR